MKIIDEDGNVREIKCKSYGDILNDLVEGIIATESQLHEISLDSRPVISVEMLRKEEK